MEAARVSILPRPGVSRASLTMISLAALVAVMFFTSVAMPYLLLSPAVLTRYQPRQPWVLVHVAAGSVALLTGPLQLWLGISNRSRHVHRQLGLVYVAAVVIGSIAAFYLAAHTSLGWGFATGITGLGVAWVSTTALAIAAVRRGVMDQHKEWMIRSYVVTFAFVTFRAAWTGLQAAGIGTRDEQLAMCSWFCWAAPLLIAEVILQRRKIFSS